MAAQFYDSLVPTDAYDEVKLCAVLAAGWLSIYLLSRHVLFRQFSADFSNRIVSLIHAAIGLVWPLFVIDFKNLSSDVGNPTTPAQLDLLRVSFAYFFYDMLCCFAIKIEIADVFHHVATLVGLYVGVFHKVSGHELLLCLTLMEASNPFMHMRSIFRETGMAKSAMASNNDLFFALSFLVCRGILGPVVVYWTILSPRTPLVVKAGGFAIQLVSLFWMSKIISVILKKLSKKAV